MFETFDMATDATTIHGLRGGSGAPVLLLHGIPETHLMWHKVAPALAERFTVVATDLRGYGQSGKPPSTPDHAPYSKREFARDQVQVMEALGFKRFAVVGHDRGARCAYRMALDYPEVVDRLGVLDIVPTGDTFERADMAFSLNYWVWSFLAAPEPIPEELISRAPAVVVNHMLDSWAEKHDALSEEIRREYVAQFSDPETIHAICEEYRASASLDYQLDADEKGKRHITCPTLVLWSEAGFVGRWYQPLEVWARWATNVRGAALPTGHFIPEEAPQETLRHLFDLLG